MCSNCKSSTAIQSTTRTSEITTTISESISSENTNKNSAKTESTTSISGSSTESITRKSDIITTTSERTTVDIMSTSTYYNLLTSSAGTFKISTAISTSLSSKIKIRIYIFHDLSCTDHMTRFRNLSKLLILTNF